MRDIILLGIIFAGIPFTLKRPWIGVIYWVWVSLMNPHRLAWGIAYNFPVAQLIAAATMIGVLVTREPRQMKGGLAAATLLAFILYTCLTTLFALVPEQANPMLVRVLKIQALTFIALLVLHKREHVIWMVWVITLSIGYFAVKGGVFTILTAGEFRVWGPDDSFIAENNALAVATIMTIPLWAYLFIMYRQHKWRWFFVAAILLSAVSALGSHSRGASIAIVAMALFLWTKSRSKFLVGAGLVTVGLALFAFMPANWHERMETISEYNEDESAMGRIETWHLMFDIAKDRPFLGAGFEPYSPEVLSRYRPEYNTVHAAHSIYFEVLGEQGFVGFSLFILFWVLTWLIGTSITRLTKGKPDEEWAFWLARMVQVSLIGYWVGGAFLSLAYWDMPYYLMVVLAVTRYVVQARRAEAKKGLATATAPLPVGTSAAPAVQAGSAPARSS